MESKEDSIGMAPHSYLCSGEGQGDSEAAASLHASSIVDWQKKKQRSPLVFMKNYKEALLHRN